MDYKKCFIPTCGNDSVNSPNKLIVRIREDLREKWCRQVNVEYFKVYTMYCCEDHFNPEEDLKNYYGYKVFNQKPVLKPTAILRNIPSNLQTETPYMPQSENPELYQLLMQNVAKKRKHEDINMPSTSASITSRKHEDINIPSTSATITSRKHEDINMPSTSASTTSTFPVKVSVHTQCSVKMVDKGTHYRARKMQPKLDAACIPSTPETVSPSKQTSTSPSLFGGTSGMEDSISEKNSIQQLSKRQLFIDVICRKPKMYLGLPKPYLWLIDNIVEKSPVPTSSLCLILTLFKIKQNDTVERMSDHFEMSRSKISAMILDGIQILVNYLQNLIFLPTIKQIKRNLPLVFKINYSNVQMIIDCFEIQIVKPSNPQTQAQTWSQYKGCNTVKYLIGCCPNGFVSFISKGFGGRISDKAIVEESNLIAHLPQNAVIMADRGFKEIESQLIQKNILLLRPPSVHTGTKQTKAEVLQSKVIASLRVHVERVIRRIREFSLLKPHSVVNYKFISYLDEIVVISCGLINLQGEIIRKK